MDSKLKIAKLLNLVKHRRAPPPCETVLWPTGRTGIKRLRLPLDRGRGHLRLLREELVRIEDLEHLRLLEPALQPMLRQQGSERGYLPRRKGARQVVVVRLVMAVDPAIEIACPPTISTKKNSFLQSQFYPARRLRFLCQSA